jgi:hypothetical protein
LEMVRCRQVVKSRKDMRRHEINGVWFIPRNAPQNLQSFSECPNHPGAGPFHPLVIQRWHIDFSDVRSRPLRLPTLI